MGMFGKVENVEQEMKKVESEAISSIIDKSMSITGEISFKGKARIDGTINGNIDGEHLILSETGKVNGDITVSSFNCYGALEGNIKAGMLTARKNCSIHGKLEASSLTVEPGASIQGEIKAAAKDETPAPKQQPAVTAKTGNK
ncbi:bactofilin family protein [Desulforhopalus sp. 52FAK]